MDRKTKIKNLINKAYEFEKTFVSELTDAQKSCAGRLENWSAKDVVAHNASWKERHSRNIIAVQEGGNPVRVTDFDQENERLFNEHNQKSWQEVLEYASKTHEKLLKLIEKLMPETLETFGYLPWQEDRPLWRTFFGYGYSHPLVHLAEHYRYRGEQESAAKVIGMMADDMVDLDDSPPWQGAVHYNRACQHSLLGQKDEAISELTEALRLNDGLTEWAKEDPDLEGIRGEAEFATLTQV